MRYCRCGGPDPKWRVVSAPKGKGEFSSGVSCWFWSMKSVVISLTAALQNMQDEERSYHFELEHVVGRQLQICS